ncbi:MAG: Hpt domain-containing protein, partial [Planctomycetia bacterium]|nr:Hpt domain-containing protein [Planctomycetia bacterium]
MSTGADDFGGVPLFDLFRMEVEAHTQALDEGLLALEQAPRDPARLEAMMRAAHSMKGAARIVGLTAAVEVAHVMEDVLVAAQKGKVVLGASDVDALLAGNDVLREVAKRDEAGAAAFLDGKAADLAALVARIGAVARGEG